MEDEQGLFFGQTTFPVKVVLEECNVRFRRIRLGIELFVGRGSHGRSLYLMIMKDKIKARKIELLAWQVYGGEKVEGRNLRP